MYPGHNQNPFIVEEDEHEFEDEDMVSPLSTTRRTFALHSDIRKPNRFSRGGQYDNEAQGHSHSPYDTVIVEEPSESDHFNRVSPESEERNEQDLPRSALSSAEEFRLPSSRDEEDLGGIDITQHMQELHNEEPSWEPTQPPSSTYRPNTADDFEDVELNKSNEKSDSPLTKKRTCTENKVRLTLWVLVLALPFVVLPLAIFGGLYDWGNPKALCKSGGGTWEGSTSSCHY